MRVQIKAGIIFLVALCLVLVVSMGMQPNWNEPSVPGKVTTLEPNCGTLPMRSLTLVPEGAESAAGCMAPTHIELVFEPALMSIIEGLPQDTLAPGMYLEWETPGGFQMVDKDGMGGDIGYLTHDDIVYLDTIRLDMSPWNKTVFRLLADQMLPHQKVFLYWHLEPGLAQVLPRP
ncbi:MAG TPA: hypothetical protein VJZ71_15035 [Phycisphaerae bacterium]|nr:hypothetical protein [Phycisphaerae bacterium]